MIQTAAVLGAGTMGSQIAGLLADCGIVCYLLDLKSNDCPNRLADAAKNRLTSLRPSAVSTPSVLDRVITGNLIDDLPRLAEVDWVIEAVSEDVKTKRLVWADVIPHVESNVILSTNTSGIPISSIGSVLPPDLRKRFIGAHFFNPPRYLPLLEIIPTDLTDTNVSKELYSFGEDVLGRGIIMANDVPNFVGNRIGTYAIMLSLKAMDEFGLTPEEVDALTGKPIGRPSSATFRTLDLIGIDVFEAVLENSIRITTDSDQLETLEIPSYFKDMIHRGWCGEKTGQGFYRKTYTNEKKQISVLNLDSLEYQPMKYLMARSLDTIRNIEDPRARINKLIRLDDITSRFAWRVLSKLMLYGANLIGNITDEIVCVDRAMRWGFAWEIGPFEIWDSIGVQEVISRMQTDGLDIPEWVLSLANNGDKFYSQHKQTIMQATPAGEYMPVIDSALESFH